MEQPFVTAVTHSTDEARLTLLGVPDQPGVVGRIFSALAAADINVDMIIQNEPFADGRRADVSFTVPREDSANARAVLAQIVEELAIEDVTTQETMGKVTVIGAGMRSHSGIAAKVFTVLGEAGINIEMISTSPIKISCVIAGERVDDAVRLLHAAFDLAHAPSAFVPVETNVLAATAAS
jgi:aspartate kinase